MMGLMMNGVALVFLSAYFKRQWLGFFQFVWMSVILLGVAYQLQHNIVPDLIQRKTWRDENLREYRQARMNPQAIKIRPNFIERGYYSPDGFRRLLTSPVLKDALPTCLSMPGLPKFTIVPGIDEHTAHHRGALTVYSRLLGLTPPMPYMEMQDA